MRGQTSNVLRWPLLSWRNLSITAAAVLIVLYGMGRFVEPAKVTPSSAKLPLVAASPSSPQPYDPPAASPSPISSPVPSKNGLPKSAVSGVSENRSVTRLATAFTQAWSSSGRPQEQWVRGLNPFVTPALAAGLAQSDPGRVPATKVTGEAVLLTASATSAQVRVPTDGGSIVVTVQRQSSGPWKVSDVAPAGQPPGASAPDLHPSTSPARG